MSSKSNQAEQPRILIVGMGNRYRRDDGVGPVVAGRFEQESGDSVQVVHEPADPMRLIDLWRDRQLVIIIDAARSGEKPGTILRFEPLRSPLPEEIFPSYSTHTMGLTKTIELARTLDRLPRRLVVYGIEAQNLDSGEGLSVEVEAAVPRVVCEITADLTRNPGHVERTPSCMSPR